MDEVADVPPETSHRKPLEDFRVELKELLESLNPEESDSLEGFSSVCNHGLKNVFGGCPILKVRKLISETEYMLWFIARVHEEFVYTLILKVDWKEDLKTLKTYKRMEEINPNLIEDFSFRSFEDLFGFISSGERFDYSVVSNVVVENALPSFDAYLNQISDPASEESSDSSEEPPSKQPSRRHLEDRRYQEEREYRKRLERKKHLERKKRRERSRQNPKKNSLRHKYRVYKHRGTETREVPGNFHRQRRQDRTRNNRNKFKREDRERKQVREHKQRNRKSSNKKRETQHRLSPEVSREKSSSEAVYTSSDESSAGGLVLKNHNMRKGKESGSETSSDMLKASQ